MAEQEDAQQAADQLHDLVAARAQHSMWRVGVLAYAGEGYGVWAQADDPEILEVIPPHIDGVSIRVEPFPVTGAGAQDAE